MKGGGTVYRYYINETKGFNSCKELIKFVERAVTKGEVLKITENNSSPHIIGYITDIGVTIDGDCPVSFEKGITRLSKKLGKEIIVINKYTY